MNQSAFDSAVSSQATKNSAKRQYFNRPLNIGVTCYPTFGGSGVIATELGIALASRGHKIHFITYDIPRRLTKFTENTFYHEVKVYDYPLFTQPPYALNLVSKMVEVAQFENLDLLHVHYAVPHATSAYLAKQILKENAPKIITTLHGTDITLVGSDPSLLPVTKFSIMESDGITAPSEFLRKATYDKLGINQSVPIEVINNFVNTEFFCPAAPEIKKSLYKKISKCSLGEKILVHVSNFRPVKRIGDIIRIFAKVQQRIPSHLVLVGDGPERSAAESLVRELGLSCKVCFLGKQETFVEILQSADVFLLPSDTESFGLAALEAMSCGIPIVATNVGGIPEVVTHEETGFLAPLGDIEAMAHYVENLLSNSDLASRMGAAARNEAVTRFSLEALIPKYEDYFLRVLGEQL